MGPQCQFMGTCSILGHQLPSQHSHVGPTWAQHGQRYGPHVGSPCGAHVILAAGPEWGPYGQAQMGPKWVLNWAHVGSLCGARMGPTWVPFGVSLWASSGTQMGKEDWLKVGPHYGPHIGFPCGAHVILAAGPEWGPYEQAQMCPKWVLNWAHVGSLCGARMGPTWVPFGCFRCGLKMGPHYWSHVGRTCGTHIILAAGPKWAHMGKPRWGHGGSPFGPILVLYGFHCGLLQGPN